MSAALPRHHGSSLLWAWPLSPCPSGWFVVQLSLATPRTLEAKQTTKHGREFAPTQPHSCVATCTRRMECLQGVRVERLSGPRLTQEDVRPPWHVIPLRWIPDRLPLRPQRSSLGTPACTLGRGTFHPAAQEFLCGAGPAVIVRMCAYRAHVCIDGSQVTRGSWHASARSAEVTRGSWHVSARSAERHTRICRGLVAGRVGG